MLLTHTSPAEITTITTLGRFNEFLFFSSNEYVMTAGNHITYTLELNDASVIDADQLFYQENAKELSGLVEELAARFGIDECDAEALIEESKSIFDIESNVQPEDLADAAWDVQLFTARAAKTLGFRAVCVSDEQGTAYIVDMLDRVNELVKK